MSIVQNGKLPKFLGEEMLNSLKGNGNEDRCIVHLQRGLAQLGIIQVMAPLCMCMLGKVSVNYVCVML